MSLGDDSQADFSVATSSQSPDYGLNENSNVIHVERTSEDDEGINNESDVDNDDEDEIDDANSLTPDSPHNQKPVLKEVTRTTSHDFHPLLQADITDAFMYISEMSQAGISYRQDDEDTSKIIVTLNFHTDSIETETACQWQICNKQSLTCQLCIDSASYLHEKVIVLRLCQICDCHPANETKVPFIERLARDFVDNVSIDMETLKLSRAAVIPELRLKYFLETLTDQYKCEQYKEMSLDTADENVLNEIFENEILDSSAKTAAKLSLLKPPRQVSSNGNIHYDLKNLPKFHHGYIVQFYKYMEYRLKNLNSLCVMCGKRTCDPNDKKASKPSICDDYECFSNSMDSKFRNDPLPPSIFSIEIADFLLLLVNAAIHSTRHELILDPYPKLINPYNTSTTLLDQNGNKTENLTTLKSIMNGLIKMGSITQYEVVKISLRSMIELKHPWAFSFFHWLMGTNRYHFSFIPKDYQIQSVSTKYQYFIKHEDIEKHVKFKKLRAEKGSIFAFHGSPQENWHAILRQGLQIGKGGYLINGAAYGEGIYVSPSFEFSAGYTRSRSTTHHNNSDYEENKTEKPLENHRWSCMALCEIINSESVYKKHSNDIWTIQNPEFICTRFIFFFPNGTAARHFRVDSEKEATPIRQLIHQLNNIVL